MHVGCLGVFRLAGRILAGLILLGTFLAARRAGALGVGLLSGVYGREELERTGAYRVYNDPADLLWHLGELGVREG